MTLSSLIERLREFLHRIFFWLPSALPKASEEQPELSHDHALVLAVTEPERIPRFRQLRYIMRFFSVGERRVFLLTVILFALSCVSIVAIILRERVVTVPVPGGEITEAIIGQPKYINPLHATLNDADNDLSQLIYSGLFRFVEAVPVPDLAESFSWSEDRKSLTIQLRKNAYFHDGQPLTTEDVRLTFDMLQDPAQTSPLSSGFRGVTMEIVDATTITFHLERPDARFLSKLTVGILPSHLWSNISAANTRLSDLNQKPVGSGPYRIKSFSRDNLGSIHSYTLERNEQYYGDKPFIATITFQFFPDQREALDALKGELVDAVAFVETEEALKFVASPRIHDISLDLPQETIAFFNLKDPLLGNSAIRRALALSVNRADIVTALEGMATPVFGPYPFAETTSTTPNLDEAREILTKAGWTLPEGADVRKTGGASSTELTLTITVPDDPDLLAVAHTLERQWSILGARVNLDIQSTEEVTRGATRERRGQIILVNVLLGGDQDVFPFWWSGQAVDRGLNISNLSDRNVDTILEQTRIATSTEAVNAARNDLTSALNTITPAVFLIRPKEHYLLSNRISFPTSTLRLSTPAERFEGLLSWYLSSGLRWK